MSTTDPVLKSMKYLIQEFHLTREKIEDTNPYFEQFCQTLELCFLKGIKQGYIFIKLVYKVAICCSQLLQI